MQDSDVGITFYASRLQLFSHPVYSSNMAAKKKASTTEVIPVIVEENKELILEGDPEAQLAFASKAAKALMGIVSQKKNPVMIRGKQYIEFSDWQVLARFYGATVEIEWSRKLEADDGSGNIIGYEARALVRRNGEIISSAEGMCTRSEKRWRDADEYAVRSMAQTRTSAKALRNAFGWVAELAGYASTPLEEMPPDLHEPIKPYRVERVVDDKQFLDSEEIEAVRETQKEQIKDLLMQLNVNPKTLSEARTAINAITGVLFFEENYVKIIDILRAKVDSKDPIAEFLKEE